MFGKGPEQSLWLECRALPKKMELQPSPPTECPELAQLAGADSPDSCLKSVIAFDVEFTGLEGAPHLLEIGAVRVEEGEVQEHFQCLVAPPVPITPEVTALTGIDEGMIRSAPFAREALGNFFEWMGDSVLLAHNARQDAHVLAFECARAQLAAPDNAIFDSLALTRKAWPEAPDHGLATLIEHLCIKADPLHRALADATACWQVCAASLEQLGAGDEFSFADLCAWSSKPTSVNYCLPVRPIRRPAMLRKLESARSTEQALSLLYGDKINPPARITLTPRFLYRANKHDYLEGECPRSGTLRTYRVDRIIKVETNK